MFYGGGAIVIRKQNQLIDLFNSYGAVNEEKAISPDALGIRKSFIFYRMVERNVFVQCENGRYYIDNIAAANFKEQRRRKALLVLIIFLVICGISYIFGVR